MRGVGERWVKEEEEEEEEEGDGGVHDRNIKMY